MQPNYDNWLEKPYQDEQKNDMSDLTDEMIEYIEEKTALCRNCKGYKCGECEV